MDRRDTMALNILTTLIMEPEPPEGYDWVLNQLTEHLPPGTPHRVLLAKASVLLADTLIECLELPPEFPEAQEALEDSAPGDVPIADPSELSEGLSDLPSVEVGTSIADD